MKTLPQSLVLLLLIFFFLVIPSTVSAATCQWVGAAHADWDVAGNWSNCGGNVPGSTDDVYLSPGDEPDIDQMATISGLMMFGTATMSSGLTFDYDAITGGPLTIANDLSMDTYTYMTHTAGTAPGGTDTITGRINLLVDGDVGIATTSSITANGKGYPYSAGPGQGCDGDGAGGGGYAGIGGGAYGCSAEGAYYGTLHDPALYGSGGGYQVSSGYGISGAGGGAIKLRAEGDVVVYGTISSNGDSGSGSNGGGGSGGSVWLYAFNIGGNGTISATGGNGGSYGGGGGGGRIYMDVVSIAPFTGTYTAAAGTSGNYVPGSYPRPKEGEVVSVETTWWGNPENLVFHSSTVVKPSDQPLSYRDITVKAGKTITLTSDTDVGARRGVHFTTSHDFILEQGATLSAVGTGHLAGGTGFGTGYDNNGASGGGFGGYGGSGYANANQGGSIYGKFDFLANTLSAGFITVGSGAGNNTSGPTYGTSGAGGGGIWLTVENDVRMSTGSSIMANGQSGIGNNGGGGSGGAIILDVKNQLKGDGAIQANGGHGGPYGGGGGGGRVYIDVDEGDYNYSGTMTATKGTNGVNNYHKQATDGSVVVINDYGSLEIRSSMTMTTADHPIYYPDIIIAPNLQLTAEGYSKMSTISGTGITMETDGEFFLPGTSSIVADGQGHPEGYGVGVGCTADGPGGGGYGGAGTRGYGCAGTGATYGNANGPISLGSGGGINTSGPGWGVSGAGGGAIKIIAGGRLTLDGTISANSGTSTGNNGAGGAGGSIWIQAYDEFLGDGIIRANGGAGGPYAGGGGGGRILIEHTTDNFEGMVTANGGSGGAYSYGGTAGNGTITYSDL